MLAPKAPAIASAFALLALSNGAFSAEPEPEAAPETGVFYRELLAARVNPLGLLSDLRVSGRKRLLEPKSSLTKDSFAGMGATFAVTPAYIRAGTFVEVQPLPILTLGAGFEALGYFGSFAQVQSFPTAAATYDDDTLTENANNDQHYVAWMRVAFIEARVQGKIGPIVARSAFFARHTLLDGRSGDVAFYDQIFDILVPTSGWLVTDDTDVLVFANDHWIIGARYTFTHSFLPEPAPANETHRLGPLIAYRFHNKPYSMFAQPTVNLLAQWWLSHPYRTGLHQPTALPLIAIAFAVNGYLL